MSTSTTSNGNASETRTDAADSSGGVATPAVSLPTGGGAIRGIGEKLSVNLPNGAASMTVPIAVSPGRSGFAPELSLSYDSGAGNGPFGFGWRLILPSITRKTDRGVPRYDDDAESDVFLLSNADDLVPSMSEESSSDWRVDDSAREGYRVRRYRPRSEGPIGRVERWTRIIDGDTHWRTISRENVLSVYGFDASSRIVDPDNPERIFSWLICESYDGFGNAIVYQYAAEDSANVDVNATCEQRRKRDANKYPKRILYGNRVPLLLDPDTLSFRRPHTARPDFDAAGWMFETVFDYGEGHCRPRPADIDGRVFVEADAAVPEGSSWSARRDPFSVYRSGFELRTYRLCRAALMFHHFPDELGVPDYLVRATHFVYDEKSFGSFIRQVKQTGYRRLADGRYLERAFPALELSYAPNPLHNPAYDGRQLQEMTVESADDLPLGIDELMWHWVDLDGEGIPGALSVQEDVWYYKRNLGQGRFGPLEPLAAKPSYGPRSEIDVGITPAGRGTGVTAQLQLLDLAGDGRLELVDIGRDTPGFFGRTDNGGWSEFRPFSSWPNLPWDDPNVRLVDLTGDGHGDILVTGDETITFYPSLGARGFGGPVRIPLPGSGIEDRAPRFVYGGDRQSLFLADLSGDGLHDLVRIRNGEVSYWPNLGYGRFGSRLTMDNAPWFDRPEMFDPRRLRLGDIDGSGTTDIVYVGSDAIRVYLNQAGNAWSKARVLDGIPAADDHAAVTLLDLLGRGTACLCWSSSVPGNAQTPFRYVDLMEGRKPHLLVEARNQRGTETVLRYTPSTEFYLRDRAAGADWGTRLPFPVQVVERIETYDRVSRNRFVTRYSYHHGYFDGVDREFRGFGRVNQLDTEQIAALTQEGAFPVGDNVDAGSHVPPVLTKTWFHTGTDSSRNDRCVSRVFEREYYHETGSETTEATLLMEDSSGMLLDETSLPHNVNTDEARAAARALRGALLRREVYAMDGTSSEVRPYLVEERNYTLRLLQPRVGNSIPVFLAHAREAIIVENDRHLTDVAGVLRADPRVVHTLTLEADHFGNPLLTASVAYGRRFSDRDPVLTDDDRQEQQRTRITFTASVFTNSVEMPDAYRTPALHETRVFELHNVIGPPVATGSALLFSLEELRALIAAASDETHDLPYEDVEGASIDVSSTSAFRRVIDHVRVRFRRNDLSSALPLGSLESLALPFETRKLALTSSLASTIFVDRGKLDAAGFEAALADAGYVRESNHDGWWITSRRVAYSPGADDSPAKELNYARQHFFLACRYSDPYGNVTTVSYDGHNLLPLETRDPVGNRVTAGERDGAGTLKRSGNDYRVLKPALIMDANRNVSAAAFDALGMVVGTAVIGKPEDGTSDSLDEFEPDLSDADIAAYFADPNNASEALLQRATRRVVIDLTAYLRSESEPQPKPTVVGLLARQTHVADLKAGGQMARIKHSFSYRDGFGREIQKKDQAAPGPVQPGGPIVTPRWVGSGWTIFNNKGNPVRQYQPFFDNTHTFRFGVKEGVGSTRFYDPVGRTVGVVHPHHAWEKVHVDPWRHESWDVNDTVLIEDPAADPDVGEHFRRLPNNAYLPTWHAARTSGALGAAEEDAANKTADHASTPVVTFRDALGRIFLTVAHNRQNRRNGAAAEPSTDERLRTRIVYDIEGNQRRVIDALGRTIARYDYDLVGNCVHTATMDGGERWLLADVGGRHVRGWDARGHAFVTAYDAAGRPTSRTVRGSDPERSDPRTLDRDVVFELTQYGEDQPDDVARNLRTRAFRSFHCTGLRMIERYDNQGNSEVVANWFTEDHKTLPDWTNAPSLQADAYVCRYRFDALNRITSLTVPDGSIAHITYNDSSRMAAIDINLRGAEVATPFVRSVGYSAQGQRTRIVYGNNVTTNLEYDPLTFRLTRVTTTRPPRTALAETPLFTDAATVQDLRFAYDPIGNVTSIVDEALATVVSGNGEVRPAWPYRYDAMYRLIEAAGREHAAQGGWNTSSHGGDHRDYPFAGASQLSDLQALRRYVERYSYDAAGNILEMAHQAAGGGWTRSYSYDEASLLEPERAGNRLSATSVGDPESYTYDEHGSMTRMPHLPVMQWNFKDELIAASRQVAATPEITYFGYAADGRRTRKVTERQNGTRRTERLYVEGWEIYREYAGDGTTVTLARESLHVFDGKRRIAIVDTQTVAGGVVIDTPVPATRYQLGNHLGSVCLELDHAAGLISYEEYTPYGSPAVQTGASATEVRRRRYRYLALERDNETGLGHHGARYYAPWLGRWSSCDPSGLVAGQNAAYFVSCKQPDADSRRYPFDPRLARWSARDPIIARHAGREGDGAKARRAVEWPQNWNLYGYANDNPATLMDTSGRLTTGDIVGAAVGIAIMLALLITTLLLLPTGSSRLIYLGVVAVPALSLMSIAAFTAALEESRVIRVRSPDRITAFSEGRVFDFWALGHYFMPAFFSGLLSALLAKYVPSLSPDEVLLISGFTTMALATGWELIERPVVDANEYGSNIVGDVVIGSIGGIAASYGVLLAFGRPPGAAPLVTLGLFIPVWGGALTLGFVNNGVINPTRDAPTVSTP